MLSGVGGVGVRGAALSCCLLSACLPAGRELQLTDEDLAVVFAVRHRGDLLLGVERIDPSGGSAVSLPVAEDETLSIVGFGPESLRRAHMAFDLDRALATELFGRPRSETCATRVEAKGERAEVPLPTGVQTWVRAEPESEEAGRLTPSALPPGLAQSLGLRVPLTTCGVPLVARPFAMGGQALESPFALDGRLYDVEDSDDKGADTFTVRDAAYLDADTALAVTVHGLLVIRRGERVRSTEDPRYFASTRLLPHGPGLPWVLHSVAVRPTSEDRPLRVFVAGYRPDPSIGEFESVAALLSFDRERLEVLSSTVTLGKVGRAVLDREGRFLVPTSEFKRDDRPSRRHVVIVADPERESAEFYLREHSKEVKEVAASPVSGAPHAVLTQRPVHFQLADLGVPDHLLEEEVRLESEVDVLQARSLALGYRGDALEVVVGGETGQLLVRTEPGVWRQLPRFLDAAVRRYTKCHTEADPCGAMRPPSELSELMLRQSEDGPSWSFMMPKLCPHVLATRLDGCTSLVELDRTISLMLERILYSSRPSPDGRVALVGGRAGVLYELAP